MVSCSDDDDEPEIPEATGPHLEKVYWMATFIYGVFVFRNPDVGSSFICLVLLFCCMIVCGFCTAITIANYIKNNKEKR